MTIRKLFERAMFNLGIVVMAVTVGALIWANMIAPHLPGARP